MKYFRKTKPLVVFFLCRIILGSLPFLQVPFLIKSLGLNSWSKIAIVQSLAIFLGPLIDLGWSQKFWDDYRFPNKAKLLITALRQKCLMLILVSLCSLSFLASISREDVSDTSGVLLYSAFLSTLTGYISSSWYWISTQSLRSLIMFEILPRVCFNLIAIIHISMYADSLIFFFILTLANLVPAILIFLRFWKYLLHTYKDGMIPNIRFAVGWMLRTGYITSTLWIISYLGQAQIILVAVLDKLYRLVSALLEPLSSNFLFQHTKADSKHLVKENVLKQVFATLLLFPALVNSIVSNILFGWNISYGIIYWLYFGMALTVVISRSLTNAFSIYSGEMRRLSKFQVYAVLIFFTLVLILTFLEIPIRVLAASIIAESFYCFRIYRAIFVK